MQDWIMVKLFTPSSVCVFLANPAGSPVNTTPPICFDSNNLSFTYWANLGVLLSFSSGLPRNSSKKYTFLFSQSICTASHVMCGNTLKSNPRINGFIGSYIFSFKLWIKCLSPEKLLYSAISLASTKSQFPYRRRSLVALSLILFSEDSYICRKLSSGLSNIENLINTSPSLHFTGLPSLSCTNLSRNQHAAGLQDKNILGVLNVSDVFQRIRENITSAALSEISDASSTKTKVASIEPKREKSKSAGRSAISFIMITDSFQKVIVPSILFMQKFSSSFNPHSFITFLMVTNVDSFRDLIVLRATTARILGNLMQLLTSHALPIYELWVTRKSSVIYNWSSLSSVMHLHSLCSSNSITLRIYLL